MAPDPVQHRPCRPTPRSTPRQFPLQLTPPCTCFHNPSAGYLDHDKATGWDVAAMSDMNWDYANSCGRCLEVRCDPSTFSDYYGESFDRTNVCRDTGASVILQVRGALCTGRVQRYGHSVLCLPTGSGGHPAPCMGPSSHMILYVCCKH